jgi:hypothetical protein
MTGGHCHVRIVESSLYINNWTSAGQQNLIWACWLLQPAAAPPYGRKQARIMRSDQKTFHIMYCTCSLEIGTTYSAAKLSRLLKPAYAVCALGLIGSLERYAQTSFRKKQNKPTTKTCTCHSRDKTTYTSVILQYSHYMDQFCAVTTNCITSTILRTKILISLIIHLCFVFVCLI